MGYRESLVSSCSASQTSVPVTEVTGPGVPLELLPFKTKPSTSNAYFHWTGLSLRVHFEPSTDPHPHESLRLDCQRLGR